MHKLKTYERFETGATLMWFLMDFFWMHNYNYASTLCGALAVWMSLFSIITYEDGRKSVHIILVAAFFWVMMSFCWVLGDFYERPWLIIMANIYFAICLFLSIFAFVIARKEKESLGFKRMKID
jgi:hypothetical protein